MHTHEHTCAHKHTQMNIYTHAHHVHTHTTYIHIHTHIYTHKRLLINIAFEAHVMRMFYNIMGIKEICVCTPSTPEKDSGMPSIVICQGIHHAYHEMQCMHGNTRTHPHTIHPLHNIHHNAHTHTTLIQTTHPQTPHTYTHTIKQLQVECHVHLLFV